MFWRKRKIVKIKWVRECAVYLEVVFFFFEEKRSRVWGGDGARKRRGGGGGDVERGGGCGSHVSKSDLLPNQ